LGEDEGKGIVTNLRTSLRRGAWKKGLPMSVKTAQSRSAHLLGVEIYDRLSIKKQQEEEKEEGRKQNLTFFHYIPWA